jgi:hypothetical protein
MKTAIAEIPAGNYMLGDKQAEVSSDEYLLHQEYQIPAFSIDVSPVTNKRYGYCIQAGVCSRPDSLQSEYANSKNADKLVVNITALDAAEFCNWLGMRLPSEKEWELAAIKNKIKLPASQPNTVSFFYEWTSSPYTPQNTAEWTNILADPPEMLTLKGGSLATPMDQILTHRQNTRSIFPDGSTGFRCAKNN